MFFNCVFFQFFFPNAMCSQSVAIWYCSCGAPKLCVFFHLKHVYFYSYMSHKWGIITGWWCARVHAPDPINVRKLVWAVWICSVHAAWISSWLINYQHFIHLSVKKIAWTCIQTGDALLKSHFINAMLMSSESAEESCWLTTDSCAVSSLPAFHKLIRFVIMTPQ